MATGNLGHTSQQLSQRKKATTIPSLKSPKDGLTLARFQSHGHHCVQEDRNYALFYLGHKYLCGQLNAVCYQKDKSVKIQRMTTDILISLKSFYDPAPLSSFISSWFYTASVIWNAFQFIEYSCLLLIGLHMLFPLSNIYSSFFPLSTFQVSI